VVPKHKKFGLGLGPGFDSLLKWDYNSPMKKHTDLHVRLPQDLYRVVCEFADRNGYSLNTSFIVLLRKGLTNNAKEQES
jgi:hypothetical protein